MAESPSETEDEDAGSAESAEPDDMTADEEPPPPPLPPPDVGGTLAVLNAVVMEKDNVHVENNLLSDHLMVSSFSLRRTSS